MRSAEVLIDPSHHKPLPKRYAENTMTTAAKRLSCRKRPFMAPTSCDFIQRLFP